MDYTDILEDIKDSVQAQVGYQNQFQTDLNVIRAEMEQTQQLILTDISGDQEIMTKLEQANYSLGFLEIVLTLILIYHFIERCFR